jgi:hypothetical protein
MSTVQHLVQRLTRWSYSPGFVRPSNSTTLKNEKAGIRAFNEQYFRKLPKFRYLTGKKRYTIEFESKLLTAEESNRMSSRGTREGDYEVIERFLAECKQHLLIMNDKLIHRNADFNSSQFREWLEVKTDAMRNNPPSIMVLCESAQKRFDEFNQSRRRPPKT